MRSQPLPTVVAVSPGREDGGAEKAKKDDFLEKLNLDLAIGSGRKKIKQEKKEPLFSAAQFHDLYNQIVVYNSIVLGLPLSFHLLLPVWMSVFNSLGPDIYKKYPSLAGFSPHSSDQSSAMDPEPGRCRRTDGRKWRCSKNVLPCQKYCERHMHRGRQGSRKHVEPIESAASHENMASDDTTKLRIMSFIASDIDTRIVLNQNRPYYNYRNDECHDDLLAVRTSDDAFDVGSEVKKDIYGANACLNSKNKFTTDEGNLAEGKFSSDDANPRKIGAKKQSVGRSNCMGFVSPRFGSSPKSVLHCAAGKVDDSKNVKETEIQRCRRTDGKRWQCRRDALPNQKYCEAHMHRGAKKVLNPQCVGTSLATCSMRAQASRNLDNGINLNTVPVSPQYIATTSSTSDATTITDENISFCLSHSLRNC